MRNNLVRSASVRLNCVVDLGQQISGLSLRQRKGAAATTVNCVIEVSSEHFECSAAMTTGVMGFISAEFLFVYEIIFPLQHVISDGRSQLFGEPLPASVITCNNHLKRQMAEFLFLPIARYVGVSQGSFSPCQWVWKQTRHESG